MVVRWLAAEAVLQWVFLRAVKARQASYVYSQNGTDSLSQARDRFARQRYERTGLPAPSGRRPSLAPAPTVRAACVPCVGPSSRSSRRDGRGCSLPIGLRTGLRGISEPPIRLVYRAQFEDRTSNG